jgi:hypothetical protein
LRRLLVLACLACGVLATASVALADHGDAKQACADIVNFDAGYTANVVTAVLGTVEPTCKNITYSLVVEVDPGGEVLTFSQPGTGTATPPFVIRSDAITDDDANVCVFVMSSRGGKDGLNKALDLLENTGCTTLAEEGSGGGAGHA